MQLMRTALCVAGLLGLSASETVELRGMKRIEFTADLEKGASWGVQFQLVESTIAFRVRLLCQLNHIH